MLTLPWALTAERETNKKQTPFLSHHITTVTSTHAHKQAVRTCRLLTWGSCLGAAKGPCGDPNASPLLQEFRVTVPTHPVAGKLGDLRWLHCVSKCQVLMP